jgi:hypothetical protein
MKHVGSWQLIAAIGLAATAYAQPNKAGAPAHYPYSAAFVSTISAPPGHTELVVFPLRGKAFKIRIQSAVGPFIYSPDGKALFGTCTPYPEPTTIAWCRISLETGSVTAVPETAHTLGAPNPGRDDGSVSPRLVRGFGLTPPDGRPKVISLPADNYPWTDLSLSPDGERAVASHHGSVELIDLIHSTVAPLGHEFFIAAWSPDGKLLAAREKGEKGRTILMEATSLKRLRILGPSELDWSPDSRFLLGSKPCNAHYATLEAIDVETGGRTAIKSSECQIYQSTTGWVRNDISER